MCRLQEALRRPIWNIIQNMTLKYDLCFWNGNNLFKNLNLYNCCTGNANLMHCTFHNLKVNKVGFHHASCWLASFNSQAIWTYKVLHLQTTMYWWQVVHREWRWQPQDNLLNSGFNPFLLCVIECTSSSHRKNMTTWLPWPRFHTPLHNLPQYGGRHQSVNPVATTNAFSGKFTNNRHRNSIKLSNLCSMFRKKKLLKSLSISNEILGKFGIRGTPYYQRVPWRGFENNGVWVAW